MAYSRWSFINRIIFSISSDREVMKTNDHYLPKDLKGFNGPWVMDQVPIFIWRIINRMNL